MTRVAGISDREYLARQYRDASNLNARINIHRRFSTNSYGLLRWIFDRLDLPSVCRILELGCGPGNLWFENGNRIPEGWDVTLSDYSAGMVRQARDNLRGRHPPFGCGVVDAQSIPFHGATFDAAIADHMLYHVPDRPKALGEIRRVLKPGGRFFASTIGRGHMRELAELVGRFDPALDVWEAGGTAAEAFTLENGAEQVAAYFLDVSVQRYEDSLAVTEAAPLVDYILSGRLSLDDERRASLAAFVEREMQRAGGVIRITKETGIIRAVRV
jgi:SAM-dependent methyltransferase